MDDQNDLILGKKRPISARPKQLCIPIKQDEKLPCIERYYDIRSIYQN